MTEDLEPAAIFGSAGPAETSPGGPAGPEF